MQRIWDLFKKRMSSQSSLDSCILEKEFGLSERISCTIQMGTGPIWMKF